MWRLNRGEAKGTVLILCLRNEVSYGLCPHNCQRQALWVWARSEKPRPGKTGRNGAPNAPDLFTQAAATASGSRSGR